MLFAKIHLPPSPKPMVTTTAIPLQSQDLSPICVSGGYHHLSCRMEPVSMGTLMSAHAWRFPRVLSRGISAPRPETLLEEAAP